MYLGIDLGTSAVKACLVAADGAVKETVSIPLSISHPFPGASEQSCEDWWTAACAAVNALDPALRSRVAAVGLSGQMHGAVLLDGSHQPICPAILWNDARATSECAALVDAVPEIGEITGVYPMAGFTAPKLLWLARHEPETHARIAHVLLPKDYLGLRLHGECATDPSDAAGTSWLDQRSRTWSPQVCAASATDLAWLPPVLSGTDIAGRLLPASADVLGLKPGLPVVAGAGDAAAGAVGIGAIEDEDAFISLGTSGQLFVTTDTYRPNVNSRIHAYAHTLPDRWFQMAAMLNGARPMAWLAALLDRPIEALLQEAQSAAPGPLFLPYLTGERTPHGDSEIRGGFALLAEGLTQGGLMRAVIEGIAFSFADAVAAVAKAGTAPQTLFAIGGGTRSELLMQTIADVTGCRLNRSQDADIGPALGAARLAAVAMHKGSFSEVAFKPAIETTFVPRTPPNDAQMKRLAQYRRLYPALKSVQSTPDGAGS